MRNKYDLDTLSMDDLYNNLKVYEAEIKGQSSSSSNSQNVAFVSSENTSSTNEAVNTAHEVSTASSQGQASSLTYADDVMFSFFANQSNSPQLDNEDLEQIDTDDLEEMDLKWQVAMLTMRVKRFLKNTRYGGNENSQWQRYFGFDKTKGNRNGDALRRIVPVETPVNALVVQDGIGYQIGLESLEARIVVHEKNEAVYEEDIAFLKNYHAPQDQSYPLLGQVPVHTAKQSSPRAAASISTARPVNIDALKLKVNDALPQTYSYFKAHSLVRRAFNQKSTAKTNNLNEKVKTARVNNVTTAGSKAVVNAAVGNGENVVKQDQETRSLPRALDRFQEVAMDGFVAFVGSPKKNSVLFTETECLVLSPDFKLLDESQVLLKVPRQNNMYSFDLKNVVPSGGKKD
ncbi:hypothetical protein Tco_0115889 [Tanacetum coccineum]